MPLPAAAQHALRRRLRQAGARLHCGGDFDWARIAVANRVLHNLHRAAH